MTHRLWVIVYESRKMTHLFAKKYNSAVRRTVRKSSTEVWLVCRWNFEYPGIDRPWKSVKDRPSKFDGQTQKKTARNRFINYSYKFFTVRLKHDDTHSNQKFSESEMWSLRLVLLMRLARSLRPLKSLREIIFYGQLSGKLVANFWTTGWNTSESDESLLVYTWCLLRLY